uniref:CCT domain-containing protein n=1 Tax=Oryza nivara TaxID=4536 RepID=A0A0E0HJJ7_ORYNI
MENEVGCECQLCGGRRGVVFCGAHGGRLCLQCDRALHQAHGGAGDHPRAPLCDSCNAAAAELRLNDGATLCGPCAYPYAYAYPYTYTYVYTGCPTPLEMMRLLHAAPPPPPATCSLQQRGGEGEELLPTLLSATATPNTATAAPMAMPPPPLQHHTTTSLIMMVRTIHKREERNRAKLRYNDKKKTRKFSKQIKYACRKAGADARKRVKGRFAKASSSSSSSSSIDHRL